MSSGIVTVVYIGAGVAAVLAGFAGWLRTRAEVLQLQRQQAQSKRMVIPPSVSDVERYAGATARLRVLRRRMYLCVVVAVLGLGAGLAGAAGSWSGQTAPAIAQQTPKPTKPPAPLVDETERARGLLASLGKLCRTERRKCARSRKDIGPIVASICHFHPEICGANQLPPGLGSPSAREQAEAPRVPQSVLQALTGKVADGTLAWSDLDLALP